MINLNALNKSFPINFNRLNYFQRLPYLWLYFQKQRELTKRGQIETIADVDNELCICSPNQMIEFFRTTNLQKVEHFLKSGKTEIKVQIYCQVDNLAIRVGKNMKSLLDYYGAKLILLDKMTGETLLIENIQNDIITKQEG